MDVINNKSQLQQTIHEKMTFNGKFVSHGSLMRYKEHFTVFKKISDFSRDIITNFYIHCILFLKSSEIHDITRTHREFERTRRLLP